MRVTFLSAIVGSIGILISGIFWEAKAGIFSSERVTLHCPTRCVLPIKCIDILYFPPYPDKNLAIAYCGNVLGRYSGGKWLKNSYNSYI